MSDLTKPAPANEALRTLHQAYPRLHHYLQFSTPLELLIATILSAQVRDDVVNATTTSLFKKYRTAEDYARAELQQLIKEIGAVSYPAAKAKHIREACQELARKHGGGVPRTMADLVALPGIGRKSANAILQNAFDVVEGIVVDTHVLRVAYRLGWTDTEKNAEKAEKQLMELLPRGEWKRFPWLMKAHGRAVCRAPVPRCSQCPVARGCPKRGVAQVQR